MRRLVVKVLKLRVANQILYSHDETETYPTFLRDRVRYWVGGEEGIPKRRPLQHKLINISSEVLSGILT